MAMAKLCADLKNERELPKDFRHQKFHAFIVDHGVRPNSLEEAIWVKRQLISWGIPLIPTLVDCRLTQARTRSQYFKSKMASRWRSTTIFEL